MPELHDQLANEHETEDVATAYFAADAVRACIEENETVEGAVAAVQTLLAENPSKHRLHCEVMDYLLRQDVVAVYQGLASINYDSIGAWLHRNARLAVVHCPGVLNAWIEEDFSNLYLAAHSVTQALAMAHSDEEKQAFLQGDTTTSSGKIVARLLRGAQSGLTGGWPHFSPSWIGSEGSALRKTAIAAGWTPKEAMAMVDLFIMEDEPESWLGNMRYPYAVMVCRWIVQSVRHEHSFGKRFKRWNGMHVVVRDTTTVVALPTASPVDIALAQLIYQSGPIALRKKLENHPSIGPVSDDEKAALCAAVQTQLVCGGIDALAHLVCTGNILAARQYDVYAVDALV